MLNQVFQSGCHRNEPEQGGEKVVLSNGKSSIRLPTFDSKGGHSLATINDRGCVKVLRQNVVLFERQFE